MDGLVLPSFPREIERHIFGLNANDPNTTSEERLSLISVAFRTKVWFENTLYTAVELRGPLAIHKANVFINTICSYPELALEVRRLTLRNGIEPLQADFIISRCLNLEELMTEVYLDWDLTPNYSVRKIGKNSEISINSLDRFPYLKKVKYNIHTCRSRRRNKWSPDCSVNEWQFINAVLAKPHVKRLEVGFPDPGLETRELERQIKFMFSGGCDKRLVFKD